MPYSTIYRDNIVLLMEVMRSCLQGQHRACDGGDEVVSARTTSCLWWRWWCPVYRDNILPVMEVMRSYLHGQHRACDGGDEVLSTGTTSCLWWRWWAHVCRDNIVLVMEVIRQIYFTKDWSLKVDSLTVRIAKERIYLLYYSGIIVYSLRL